MTQLRIIDRPTNAKLNADGALPGGWWHETADGRMVCDLCPRACSLKPGDRGFCFVRENRDGEMMLTTYGKSTGFCIDPIEKKPLNHFYPGTSVLSFGTAGCNLGCKFCQNHDISKAREVELLSEHATPETIANAAVELGCKSVAYTYNDPIIWAEYAIDTAKACRQVGVKSVAVTAGYITPQARAPFFEFFDAANVDLKAFTEAFYERVTLSHLQPVLDTLEWLKRETDVWFEITNLIIPDANDSPDEIRQLCDWVLKHVGDEVPVHFSAFHPDFRMLDRDRTPHETLLKAYELAKSTGLKHVYVGNVHDAQHQSTYCDACDKLVIERDWYQLGAYHLNDHRCSHCGHALAGRFDEQPGDWGRKRQPVQINLFATKKDKDAMDDDVMRLSTEQQQAVLQTAAECVAAAAYGRDVSNTDASIAGVGGQQVMGVYVSLKRQGQLRGCCGFTGQATKMLEGIRYAAQRTTCEDPRFPPVSITELTHLDLEVWLLQGLQPIQATGVDRIEEIKIGRDGVVIQRGQQRGLLLPGVATDNDWDAETFLRQVCVKAKLPPTAWREKDTVLHRFEGICAKGHFPESAVEVITNSGEPIPFTVVSHESIILLAEFCRQNVQLISSGALPNYYANGVDDGMVNGVVLIATDDAGLQLNASRISLRPTMPLHSTLFGLCEDLVKSVQQRKLDPTEIKLELAILEDPALHGTTQSPELDGADQRCLLLMGPNGTAAWQWDAAQSSQAILANLQQSLNLRPDQVARVVSFCTHATGSVKVTNKVQPRNGPSVRPSAMDGKFYPANANELSSMVREQLPDSMPAKVKYRAAMVPHAGLRFSGRVAAEVLAHIDFPERIIVIGPKHTRNGVDWAVAPHQTWSAPGIEIASDRDLAQQLVGNIPYLQLDAAAHAEEHAIEVELPFLHHFAPQSKVVGIAIGGGSLSVCQQFAAGLAKTLREADDEILLLISSDMNHFAGDAETRRLDEIAMQSIETLDATTIFKTVRANEISMCGVLPCVIAIDALQQIKPLAKSHRVRYATSADVTGEKGRVVGYAGMLFE